MKKFRTVIASSSSSQNNCRSLVAIPVQAGVVTLLLPGPSYFTASIRAIMASYGIKITQVPPSANMMCCADKVSHLKNNYTIFMKRRDNHLVCAPFLAFS